MILALDISTSITGYAIIDKTGLIKVYGHVDLRKEKCFIKKVTKAKEKILSSIEGLDIEALAIEKNLQAFRRGLSSAQVINTLARFNGALSYAVASTLNIPLTNIDVNQARRSLGFKILREKVCGLSTKEQVKQALDSLLATSNQKIQWGTRILKSGPRKGLEIHDNGVYDEVDAIVTGLAYLKICD